MKRFAMLMVVLIFALALSACSGYNNVMYAHLSNADNYDTYQATVQELDRREDGTLTLRVTLESSEDVRDFLGAEPNPERELTEYVFSLEVTAENAKCLENTDFFDEIGTGDLIDVTTAHFLYSDSEFFYVCAIRNGETVYLDTNDGLQNIVDMMDRDRSLF